MIARKMIRRGLLGFVLGTFLSSIIVMLISWAIGDGALYAVPPTLIAAAGSQLSAYVLQFVLSGLLGSAFAVGSVFFEIERWSLLKQAVCHFILSSLSMLPVAYLCHWMEHTARGILAYMGIFAFAYLVIWLVQYALWKKRIARMNEKLKAK